MWSLDVFVYVSVLTSFIPTPSARHASPEKSGPTEINVRLAVASVESAGRVEIQDASNDTNRWGTVCDDQWDNKAASVVCRQLGYKWGEKVSGFTSAVWRSQSGSKDMQDEPIFLDEVLCGGDENSLLDCVHSGWGVHDCSHTEDAGVICHNETVRLKAPTDDKSVGNVQMMHNYKWAEVCDENWNNVSARLVCQELGFVDGIPLCCSAFGSSSFANLDYSVTFDCSANDTSLEGCRSETFFDQCGIYHRASVICFNTTAQEVDHSFQIRLSSEADYWGRVEIRLLGVWGQICTSAWDDAAANVTCRQLGLGFIGGHALGYSETSKLPIWVPSVVCQGNETSIEDCQRTPWGVPADYGCKSAYVLCYRKSGVTLDIVETTLPRQGRLQLTFEGVPGSVGTEEWSDNDAHIACRQMGYASGVTVDPESGVQPYYLNKMICYSEDIRSILQCGNTGWRANATSLSKSAHLKCYKHVRLHNGGFSHGIVEVHDGQRWLGLCDLGFTKQLAQLVCRETSHTDNGEVLQTGAYGPYYRKLGRPYLNCSANATSISECPYDEQVTCSGFIYNYVSLSCYNGSDQRDKHFEFLGIPGVSYGPVVVSYKNQFGEVCSAGWGDKAANVFCRSLNQRYVGGVAVYYHKTPDVPMLLSEVKCIGNESKMAECETDERLPCYTNLRAGSVCYSESAPKVRLVDGGKSFGRVVIEVDGQSGLVTDENWSNDEASVVCKEISKAFIGGEVYSNFTRPSSGEVYLSDINCEGFETSILHCDHSGWKTTEEANYTRTVGVYCFENVRIYGGIVRKDLLMGRVQIISVPISSNAVTDTWVNVCADGFDQIDADVICRQMGFEVAEILVPGFLHLNLESMYYTNMTCKEGGTNVMKDCKFNQGACKHTSHNFANVLCRTKDAKTDIKFHIQHGHHGVVYAERFGINGTICWDGWDNSDASVICREKGFKDGVVFGGPLVYYRPNPVWFTNVSCTNESSLSDCPMSLNVPVSCTLSLMAAGVLCYNGSGITVTLENKENANYYGKIRITYDDKPGYVCRNLGAGLADLVCRELGFPMGEFHRYSDYGAVVNSHSGMWMSDLNCIEGRPHDSILACASKGWGQKNSRCYDFAEVKCQKNVMTKQADNYGAVQVWRENRYSFVCSDEFDDADATVVCRRMGYPYGKSLCCSAFGFLDEMIDISAVKCTGNEMDINDCTLSRSVKSCTSGHYASVVCSLEEPPIGFSVSIGSTVSGKNISGVGQVQINYFNQLGNMCDVNFDDQDASVICRQLGFAGGFAYRLYDAETENADRLRWLKGPNCAGEETTLERCNGINLGDVSNCPISSRAAVFCHRAEEQSGFEVRLSNSSHPGEGFVEVKVNGTWGSICTVDTFINQHVTTVICRQLKFTDGYETVLPMFPPLNGTVWLNNVNCYGDEASIKDCMLSGFETEMNDRCLSHKYDLAVKCYSDVRLSGVPNPNYGIVQVLSELNSWVSVCDVGFDDVDASIVCKSLGYKDGKAQCCSSLGSKLIKYSHIGVANVNCNGTEEKFSECRKDIGNVTCKSGMYASAICTDESPPKEDMQMKLKGGLYYGDVEVIRYGVLGSMCDDGWDNKDATVLCRSMGYKMGYATNGTNSGADPMILTSVNCVGNETNITNCSYPPLIQGHTCNDRSTRAAALCSMDEELIRYRVADMRNERGRAEIFFNGRWGTICDTFWEDRDADIFCKQAGYLLGEATTLMPAGSDNMPIWMTRVECSGNETDFLQCRASWDKNLTSRCSHFEDAGVRCYSTARLFRSDYLSKRTHGIVELYIRPSGRPRKSPWYTVCADTFTDKEADVVCGSLGNDRGMTLCCTPYGYSTTPMVSFRPKCNGTEKFITDCEQVRNETKCSRQNYASLACYNGTRPKEEYRLTLKGNLKYTGQVVINYLGVPGSICWTGWTDADARVACRELGFKNGSSYYHYKSSFIYLDYNGPYWLNNVSCNGNETRLIDCPHTGFGNVMECKDRGHYAGVVCYDDSDMAFRISGGNHRYGRVEFSYNKQWHSFCSKNWGQKEADVMCRQLGYITGDPYNGNYYDVATGDPYVIDFRCTGTEQNITSCPHEGLGEADFCRDHKDDEGVFCYTSVKLSGKAGVNNSNGTVLFYQNKQWVLVCDDGFDDVTAKMVCRELGFVDGYAICCSAYGKVYEDLMTSHTLHCTGKESSIEQCLQNRTCNSTHYASAVCFSTFEAAKDDSYKFEIAKYEKGQIQVTHYGVKGRICSRDWDDRDATVFCKTQGFDHGLAYQHSESNVLQEVRGPYWLSGFNCSGEEDTLLNCPFMDRTALGNCTGKDIASVLCYNQSGIDYRMVDGGDHYGRVEISVGGQWGTICDSFWDEREASVFCRQMNFTDGEPVGSAHFGEGKGPIWLSHLECKGTEKKLHECPHRGFANEFSFNWWFPLPCETHADDAGVFCYKSVRLNNGPNSKSGGLEMYNEGEWYSVCDTGFGLNEAKVACKSLKTEYVDARPIPGSAYGNNSKPLLFSNINCTGDEKDIINCKMDINKTCPSGHYVSVECSNTPIIDNGFEMRLSTDSLAGHFHGILEVRVGGVWGRICLHNFDDTDASVACRKLGFDGGVAYLHIMKNDRPVLMREVTCQGNETSLEQCESEKFSPDIQHCSYGSNDAGVVCYNVTNGIGFEYKLVDGTDPSEGRVQIGYAGRWGTVCSWSWQSADARVLCRSMGYVDGIVQYVNEGPPLPLIRPWVSGFFCLGNEPSPLTCLNTGFNSSFLADLCIGRKELGAHTQCFNTTVAPTEIRLVDGPDNYTGRVEVFVTGANEWGTICDDHWDDVDAHVVCRQLGFFGGQARRKAEYGSGTGKIWFDNMKCNGSEKTLFDCEHRGIGTHNCNHREDVGVKCQASPVEMNTATSTSAERITSTDRPISTKPAITEPSLKLDTITTEKPKVVVTAASTTSVISTSEKASSDTVGKTTSSTATIPTTSVKLSSQTSQTQTTPQTTTQQTTTQRQTTLKPTTPQQTTHKQTVEAKTKQQWTTEKLSTSKPRTFLWPSSAQRTYITTTLPTTTTEVTPTNKTGVLQRTSPARANIAAAVAIPLCLLLIIIIIIVIVIMARNRWKRRGYGQEMFDDSIISQDQEGNISATNQIYDLNLRPTNSNGFTDSVNSGNVNIKRNGDASYSPGTSDFNGLETSAFSNPLYEATKNNSDTENSELKLPLQEDIQFKNSKYDSP